MSAEEHRQAVTEYRFSWESPKDLHLVTAIERSNGRGVWPTYDWDTLGDWLRTEVVFLEDSPGDRWGQYNTLKRWAETREQPIRDVRLERRQVTRSDEGWEPYER